jgi:putative sugar O-methyltransferase
MTGSAGSKGSGGGPVSSEDLVARYRDLCATADRHAGEGWRSPHEDGQKRALTIGPGELDVFASMLIGGIGFEAHTDFQGHRPPNAGPVGPQPAFSAEQTDAYRRLLLDTVRQEMAFIAAEPTIEPREWLDLVRMDGVVGGRRSMITLYGEQVPVSLHTARVSRRVFELRRALGHVPRSIVEIGGGHGKFVRDVLRLAPGVRVVYCDLVFNLLLAARYLTRLHGSDVHLAWEDGVPIPADARIVLVPPWRLREVPFPVEVCCNFLSFQHMEAENIRYYGDALAALDVAVIYHHNRSRPLRGHEATLVAGAFGPDWQRLATRARSAAVGVDPSGRQTDLVINEAVDVHARHRARYTSLFRLQNAFSTVRSRLQDLEAATSNPNESS